MIFASTPSRYGCWYRECPLLIDVRREEVFKSANDTIAGAIRRCPDSIEQLDRDAADHRPIMVYCVQLSTWITRET